MPVNVSADDPTVTPTGALITHAVATLPPDLFAILDGGLHDNLQTHLASHGLRARPVFLEAGDPDAVASGPFLVPLDSAEQIGGVIAISGSGRTPVIWSWPNGEQELYRHLRTINLVLLPDESDAETENLGDEDPAPRTDGPVVFRHWDPEVLALLLPVLTVDQNVRMCGAAAGLAYHSEHMGAPAIHVHAPGGRPHPRGFLSFTPGQMQALSGHRMNASRRAIMSYLRETVPEDVDALDDRALYALVVEAEAAGNLIGLQSEHAHGLWAFLHVITGGVSSRSPEIRQHFYKAADDPHVVLQQMLDEVRAQAG